MGLHDDFGLQDAIKTTLVQLCKVGVIYQCELVIAGTVGVTVDRKRTILVHFDEKLDSCQPDTSTSIVSSLPTSISNSIVSSLPTSISNSISSSNLNESFNNAMASQSGVVSSLNLMSNNMGLPNSPPQNLVNSGNFGEYPNFSPNPKNEAFSHTLQTSIPIPINIDSDSESLCELRFEDEVSEVKSPTGICSSGMVRKKEVMWSGEGETEFKTETKYGENANKNGDENSAEHRERIESIARIVASLSGAAGMSNSYINHNINNTSTARVEENNNTEVSQSHEAICPPKKPPIKLLVDKRLFMKKTTPESSPSKSPNKNNSQRKTQTRSETRKRRSARATNSIIVNYNESNDQTASPYDFPNDDSDDQVQGMTTVLTTGITMGNPREKLCEVCSKIFQTQGLLEAHLVEAHNVVESIEMGEITHYSCKHCKKKFRYQATLDKHEFLHVAAKPNKCHMCGNSYLYSESLQIHMNIHKGILDCPLCQKMYSSRKHLQKHIVYMHEMRRVRHGNTPRKTQKPLRIKLPPPPPPPQTQRQYDNEEPSSDKSQ